MPSIGIVSVMAIPSALARVVIPFKRIDKNTVKFNTDISSKDAMQKIVKQNARRTILGIIFIVIGILFYTMLIRNGILWLFTL